MLQNLIKQKPPERRKRQGKEWNVERRECRFIFGEDLQLLGTMQNIFTKFNYLQVEGTSDLLPENLQLELVTEIESLWQRMHCDYPCLCFVINRNYSRTCFVGGQTNTFCCYRKYYSLES